jgi:hypothetical protein
MSEKPNPYEYDYEPVRGLPADLPEGEKILWQGSPDWAGFAVHALHVRLVTVYFAAIVAIQPIIAAAVAPNDKTALARAAGEAMWTAVLGLVAVGLLSLFAVLVARTSVYTITNRRIVFRIGVAIAKCVNLPFNIVAGASLRRHPGGAGDLAIELKPDAVASYVLLWPHVRPWKLGKPQPMLRALTDADQVARILAFALRPEIAADAGAALDAAKPAAPRPATAPKPEPVLGPALGSSAPSPVSV